MSETDPSSLPASSMLAEWLSDLTGAARFLTRLPLKREDTAAGEELARTTRAFPLVGAGIGLAGGVVYGAADWLGLPSVIAAFLALGAMILLTGGLHEDGLADVADGFGSGADAQEKLDIMRDSRIGAFGVIALILSLAIRAGALAALAAPGAVLAALVVAGAGSRAATAAVMAWLEPARSDGLAATAGQPSSDRVWTAVALGTAAAVLIFGPGAGVLAALIGGAAAAGVGHLARRQIGGSTGDVLGAVQQVSEGAILLVAVAAY